MIKQIEGGKKPDIEMEDNKVTDYYEICEEYGHSDEFFDFLYENCHFDRSAGEVEGVDLPKASFFEDALYEGAESMGYDHLNEKNLFAEGKAYYDPYDRTIQEQLIERYIDGHDDDYLY